jgi:serine/threonine-protein kinase
MATVYLARDLKHDRLVALKVLHPSLSESLGADRFLREVRLAARLQHPLICTVLDSGVTDGATTGARPFYWFTMPYVEGESLRDRLNRETQLPFEDALAIVREASEALEYAHQHGVVHRDIKPENILLTGKHALVADFGIAKAIASGGGQAGEGGHATPVTGTGVSIGTPAYMSPEQASGERELDGRTDVYSLGCVLYEMLAGEPPFTGPTIQTIVAKLLTTDPAPLSVVRPGTPPAVQDIVKHALARTPADRYPSAADLTAAVERALRGARRTGGTSEVSVAAPAPKSLVARRPAVLFILGITLGLGALFAWRHFGTAAASPSGSTPARLAVIPFENLGDSADAYFADGMTDEIRAKLASLSGLVVTASTSAAEYKNSPKSVQQIARELGVDYLLLGKIRWEKSGAVSRVRVSPELIQVGNVAAPTTRWEQPMDATMTDVFQVQADIAGRVASALNLALGQNEQQELASRPTLNLAAYDAYLRAHEIMALGASVAGSETRRAIALYERAVALDSGFALAWSELSLAHSGRYFTGAATPEDSAAADQAASRAFAINPRLPQAFEARGVFYNYVLFDYPKALEQFAEGRRLAPRDANLLAGTAFSQFSSGKWQDALTTLNEAQVLDPRSTLTGTRLARTYLWLRRYPEAKEAAERLVSLAPTSIGAIEQLAMVYLAQGDLAGAQAAIRSKSNAVDPVDLVTYFTNFWDLYWVLDEEQQQLVLRIGPDPYGDDRRAWALAVMQILYMRGDQPKARAYADSARVAGEAALAASPKDAQGMVLLGLADAYAGRSAEAVRIGEASTGQVPIEKDAYSGPYYQHLLARIYLRTGHPDKAVDILEKLLGVPYYLSPGWLRIDPEWKPLHGNPRFEKLIAAK